MRETLVKFEKFNDMPLRKIPKDWNCLTINDCLQNGLIVDVQDGNHGEAHPKTDDFVSEGIPFVMAKDLINGQINLAGCHKITYYQYQSLRVGFAYPGDVLLSHKGTIGLTAIVPNWLQHIMLTPQVTYYRVSQEKKLFGKFLFWFFQSPLFQQRLEVLSAQSTRSYIGITLQKTLSIFIPPFNEQKRIVEILDKINEAIARTSSLIAKLKQMKAGLLHDLLTRGLDENGELRDAIAHPDQFKDSPLGRIPKNWKFIEFGALIAEGPQNGIYKPESDYADNGVPIVRIDGFYDGVLANQESFRRVRLTEAEIRRYALNNENILINRVNSIDFVGKSAIVSEISEATVFESNIMRLVLKKELMLPAYAIRLISFFMQRQLRSQAKSAIAQASINQYDVRSCIVAIPSVEEQAQIVERLDSLDTRIRTEEAYLNKLKLQKQGLMHDLLTGKVRVNSAELAGDDTNDLAGLTTT